MKKISLFTFYSSNNMGDLLIAKKVTELFKKSFNCIYYDIMNGQKIDIDNWTFRLGEKKSCIIPSPKGLKNKILNVSLLRSAISYLKSYNDKAFNDAIYSETELAVFAGGNLLMELLVFPSNTTKLYRTVKKLKKNGKKVAFCFCGVGPFKAKWSEKIAKKLLKLLDFISVRDNASYELVKRLVPEKEVEIWRDPVLLEEYNGNLTESKTIGINVYFGADKNQHSKVKNGFVQLIKHLRENYSDYKIKLFSSELTDMEHILRVKAEFENDDYVSVESIKAINELFEMYNSVDVVLGTRMHTIITSMISKKAVTSISWQAKVTSLMEYFENQDYNYELLYFASNPYEIAEKLMECLKNREAIISKNQSKLIEIRKETKEKIENFVLRM